MSLTMCWEMGGGTYILYYGVSFCVPGFFLLSGYLIGAKRETSIQYYENKVKSVMLKLFGWTVFWAVFHFALTSEVRDIWTDFIAGSAQGGTIPVSWFLFTYTALLVLAYPVMVFRKKHKLLFDIVVSGYMALIAAGVGTNIVNSKPQSLWLHLYSGYFATGMALSDVDFKSRETFQKISIGTAIAILIMTSIVYANVYSKGAPHQHYGTWYYTLWLLAIFVLMIQVHLKSEKPCRLVAKIGNNTFAVYLGHLPILLYLTKIRPLQNTVEAILMIIFLFGILNIAAEIFRKMPLLRNIT